DAIVHRHGRSMAARMSELEATMAGRPWREQVLAVIDMQVDRLRESPAYVAVGVARELSPQARLEDDEDVEVFTRRLRDRLRDGEALTDSPSLLARCRVAVQATDALLSLAFRLDRRGDDQTVAEAKRILMLYLDSVVAEARTSAEDRARQRGA
ncbi:MAG: hypothetical protein R2731_12855, partial [Nocardioides sp.]